MSITSVATVEATNPFIAPGQRTMAQLIEAIEGDAVLTKVRRANVASSIRRFCAALGYDVSQVPANHWHFRERLKRFHPLEAGISKKRWATIKADINFAFRHAGITKGQPRGFAPYMPEWLALRNRLPSEHLNWGLSRLGRFCSTGGIHPHGVNDGVIAAFHEAIKRETFKTKPERLIRELCLRWNKTVAMAPDMRLQKVTLPSHRETYTAPWNALPLAFRRDADAWLETMSKEADLLADEGPIKPLRPASIRTYRYVIRQAFAALVARGAGPETISSLEVLVQPDNAKAVLEFFLARNDAKTGSMIAGIAHVLFLIASTAGKSDPATIEKLRRYRKQLTVRRIGLRPRPRNALRPFADPVNIQKILILPLRIHDRLRKKTAFTVDDARSMQVAVALELLLMRPIRRQNLVELRLNENVIRSGREMFIVLPSDQVKNAVDLDYRVPRESVVLIDFYVKRLLPLFGPNPAGWLFPGEKTARHKSPEQLGRYFTKTIREATGLHIYPHLTRHLGAFLYLKENPGAFEIMRRVLAHKSLATTTNSYVSFDDDAAVRLYDILILRMRDAIQAEAHA